MGCSNPTKCVSTRGHSDRARGQCCSSRGHKQLKIDRNIEQIVLVILLFFWLRCAAFEAHNLNKTSCPGEPGRHSARPLPA